MYFVHGTFFKMGKNKSPKISVLQSVQNGENGDRGGPISELRLGAPALIDSGSSLLAAASNCSVCQQELVRVQHVKILG